MRSATPLQFNSKFEADEMYMYDYKTTMVLSCTSHWVTSKVPSHSGMPKIRVKQSNQHVLSHVMSIEWLGLGTLVVTQCVNIKIIDLIPFTNRFSIRLMTRRGRKMKI